MTAFHDRIVETPSVFDAERADQVLGDLERAMASDSSLADLRTVIEQGETTRRLLAGVFGASPFLAGLALRAPALLSDTLLQDPDLHFEAAATELREALAEESSQDIAMRTLRRFKQRIALLTAMADLGGVWPIDQVCAVLSRAADTAIAAAVDFLLRRETGRGRLAGEPGETHGYFVLAMGKLGSGELNYSSDVDLIVFFDPERARLGDGQEAATLFVRVTRDLVKLLQERTSDGYVFRTDLRLRPDPGATQVALSTDAGLTYYESFGQNWERAALIKARAVAGDIAAGEAFLDALSPFVWRRYLDYSAIADIHAMKRRVHAAKGHGKVAVEGHNIKLGRGGIRDIEFFVQTQQLIAGGRQPELRERKTLLALDRLAERGWIEAAVAADMQESYRFFRRVEHRLQMVGDQQTYVIPTDPKELTRIAKMSGFADREAFAAELLRHLSRVEDHYEALFEKLPQSGEGGSEAMVISADPDPATLDRFTAMGFRAPKQVADAVRAWQSGRYPAVRSERARQRLAEVLGPLLEAFARTAEPDRALSTFDRFLSELPGGVQLFSLLSANPSLLKLVAEIMGTAPRLAAVLGRRAKLLDAVLDPGFFGALPDARTLKDRLERQLAAARDMQDRLDRARIVGREQGFLIGVRVLSGTVTAEQAGNAYALLAETLIGALQKEVEADIRARHGVLPGGEAVVVAMGKLGGREMTALSDLDLIVIYDYEGEDGRSNGERPLAASQYYARLTQRLINALTAHTAEGSLYQVDMRLRPSGNAGPVATRLSSFVAYQAEQAWTWEHLALTRARVVSGPEPLRARVEAAIREALAQPRDRAKLAADVHDMRARIEQEKGTEDAWDLKQVRGSLVDLEFLAQFHQLAGAEAHPETLDPNTLAALQKLSEAELLPPDDADVLIPAARLYNTLTQLLRLCLDRNFDPETAPAGLKAELAEAAGVPDFRALDAELRETEAAVHAIFERTLG